VLRSVSELLGYSVVAGDQTVGKVRNFLFRDSDWQVSHLVVRTGRGPRKRMFLVSSDSVGRADESAKLVPVQLTKEQLAECPEVRTAGAVPCDREAVPTASGGEVERKLRSANRVIAYRVSAGRGEIGYVDDLTVDDDDWRIAAVAIVDMRRGSESRLSVPPAQVAAIEGAEQRLQIDLTGADPEGQG